MNVTHTSVSSATFFRQIREFIDSKQWTAAQKALESLLQSEPQNVPLRIELAAVILQQGRMRAATSQLLQAVPMLPNDAPTIIHLAWHLSINGEIQGARACLAHLQRAPDPPAEVLSEQAHLHWMLGEISAARTSMDRAVALGVTTSSEYYLNAMLHQFTGRIAEAESVLLACLQRWPRHGDSAVILANLRKQTLESNHLELFRGSLAGMATDSITIRDRFARAEFESAIFKVHDDLGHQEEAWAALERSNVLMREINPYDRAGESALTEALIHGADVLAPVTATQVPRFDGPIPIFIVGMPRSGTTLLDHMLSGHSDVVSAGEILDFQRQFHWVTDVAPGGTEGMLAAISRCEEVDFAELGARYLKQTQWRAQGHKYYIDKLPINVRMVPFIRRALPQARILHLTRDPMDVCWSNLKVMFGMASSYCYDQHALAHYYGEYVRLTNHWRTILPSVMLDVSYTSLVTDPATTLHQVLLHCGLEMEESCLHPERNVAPVATPSSVQVREAIHSHTLGQWRRYTAQLSPLQQALAGYGVSVD
ncbi:tetratricopeptide repeat-containing sulfotransferase family protein [Rhodanobacter soli]|jgi:tetratricopeptide (TPR) repeat protein|uniref:Tetratricopeptide (TPR) repeat protein n=1 Tax=Rhodanobacter soli TaxID=590609 RepID=A0ABV2PW23_9GAMM